MCIIFSVGAWPLSQTGRDEFKGKALGTLTIYEDNFAPLPLPPPPLGLTIKRKVLLLKKSGQIILPACENQLPSC